VRGRGGATRASTGPCDGACTSTGSHYSPGARTCRDYGSGARARRSPNDRPGAGGPDRDPGPGSSGYWRRA
jgi:hypothetical protein